MTEKKALSRFWKLVRGLTQRKLGEITGIKQSAISRLEHGKIPIQFDALFRLFTVMNKRLQVAPLDD